MRRVVVQERDIALLRVLCDAGVAGRRHAAALCFDGSREAAKKRIQALKAAGLLEESRASRITPGVLTLTRKAVSILKSLRARHDPHTSLPRRVRPNARTLAHDLAVLDVRCAFATAMRQSESLRLVIFATRPDLLAFGEGADQVTPDGYCSIHQRGAEHRLFVEVDRSTRPLGRVAAQAQAYRAHYRSGAFAASIGESPAEYRAFPFRVLYVFKSEERLANFARKLLGFAPPITSLVWLATHDRVVADPLGAIWRTPSDTISTATARRSLFDAEKKATGDGRQ